MTVDPGTDRTMLSQRGQWLPGPARACHAGLWVGFSRKVKILHIYVQVLNSANRRVIHNLKQHKQPWAEGHPQFGFYVQASSLPRRRTADLCPLVPSSFLCQNHTPHISLNNRRGWDKLPLDKPHVFPHCVPTRTQANMPEQATCMCAQEQVPRHQHCGGSGRGHQGVGVLMCILWP